MGDSDATEGGGRRAVKPRGCWGYGVGVGAGVGAGAGVVVRTVSVRSVVLAPLALRWLDSVTVVRVSAPEAVRLVLSVVVEEVAAGAAAQPAAINEVRRTVTKAERIQVEA